MSVLLLCCLLATPFVDFGLYTLSSWLVQPSSFTMHRQARALGDWHGNVLNYILVWYFICYQFTWDRLGWMDGLKVVCYFPIVDTTFYALHRTCHRCFYYTIHQKHHLCKPIGSQCARHSHWLDAMLENLSFFAPFFVLSYNGWCASLCLLANTVWASYLHTYPARVERGAWMMSPYLHWIHHQFGGVSSCNYALYSTVWDRLLGTLNEEGKVDLVPNTQSRPVPTGPGTGGATPTPP
jgi:sterol desaturase/sphingolipid hydroxylase (fatty acid hydroxylase superfamily)